MPVKNNVEIYTQLYKYFPNICYWIDFQCNLTGSLQNSMASRISFMLIKGLKEWFLMLFIQEQLYSTLENQQAVACSISADYIKDGKFILILKVIVFNRTN